eukprot:scaffold667031_cov69-Prasinocladus_malaysianus.AAC.1
MVRDIMLTTSCTGGPRLLEQVSAAFEAYTSNPLHDFSLLGVGRCQTDGAYIRDVSFLISGPIRPANLL